LYKLRGWCEGKATSRRYALPWHYDAISRETLTHDFYSLLSEGDAVS
jgi:hypothetical protein